MKRNTKILILAPEGADITRTLARLESFGFEVLDGSEDESADLLLLAAAPGAELDDATFLAGIEGALANSGRGRPLRRACRDGAGPENECRALALGKLLEEKELLLAESHHRIKNNMASLAAMLSLQAAALGGAEAAEALRDAESRLKAMGLLYDKLFRAAGEGRLSIRDYLPDLARGVVAAHPSTVEVEIEESLEDIELDAKRLSELGILVNEIIWNKMKYAFAGRERGRIRLHAAMREGRVLLRVDDDGNEPPGDLDIDSSPGFGFTLLRSLAGQLGGSVSIERGGGAAFLLEFAV